MITHEYIRLKRCKNLLTRRKYNKHGARSALGTLAVDSLSYLVNLNILENNYKQSLYSYD